MNQNKSLLIIATLLIILGIVKPNLSDLTIVGPSPSSVSTIENYVVDPPEDELLLDKAKVIVEILSTSNNSTKKSDCLKLSSLYHDLATLIELDDADTVIKDTASIREANSLTGKMLRLDIKDKYPNLAEANTDLIVAAIGDDDVLLNPENRNQAVAAFRALSWAFYKGSK